jgi:hypothetical protein
LLKNYRGASKLTNSLVKSEKTTSAFPDNFVQSGSNIDVEIAARLTRAMWKALSASDDALRARLNSCLQEEIDSLTLQHEIDRTQDDGAGLAIAHVLEDYLQTSS